MNEDQGMPSSKELAELHRVAEVYTLLGSAFEREVSEAFLQTIIETQPELAAWAKARALPELSEAARRLGEFAGIAAGQDDRGALLEELAVEYASLFLGVGESTVDLIESVYRGEEQILYEAPYFEVLEHYRRWGYEKPRGLAEPEDHLAVELHYLAMQLRGAAWAGERQALEEYRARLDEWKDFYSDHFSLWAPRVCDSLKQASRHPFYLAVAFLMSGMMALGPAH